MYNKNYFPEDLIYGEASLFNYSNLSNYLFINALDGKLCNILLNNNNFQNVA